MLSGQISGRRRLASVHARLYIQALAAIPRYCEILHRPRSRLLYVTPASCIPASKPLLCIRGGVWRMPSPKVTPRR